ncbi:MAG: hypothetical protein MGG37_10625 [Trichodesmium sp. MAG_R01]|nr:hypothetical protein [Trichodesmium sp. MAG_R01]
MGLYLIGIGGTGAKCVEAVAKLAAIGLFTEEPIKVLFVDADETNGNLARARTSIGTYKRTYDLMPTGDKTHCGWMKSKIESFDHWSPFAQEKELRTFFNYNTIKQNQPTLANLFDVLYTKEEREANLDVGFRGRPAIGAAVMSQVDLDRLEQGPWGKLIEEIQGDTGSGKEPKIFLCGSIFGGTGASGLPTIARLIDNKLKKIKVRDRVQTGCLFVLPYFGFAPTPGENPDGVYARSEQFLLNTEAALRYYVTQGQEIFDRVYLLGNQNLSRVNFSIGKDSQRNDPHFLELYAALAARNFWRDSSTAKGSVILMTRQQSGTISWDDIPEKAEVQPELVNATRFAFTWLAEIAPELEEAKKEKNARFQRLAPWMMEFYQTGSKSGGTKPDFSDVDQQEAIGIINNWCEDYLGWLYSLHQCEGDNIALFQANAFPPNKKLAGNELPNLIVGDSRDKGKKSRDTVKKLKDGLKATPPGGTIGLAKSVYMASRI